MSTRHVRGRRWILAVVALAACGSDDTVAVPGAPELRIVAGANVTDTVQSRRVQALTVEVRDASGARVQGTVVRFDALIEASRPGIFIAGLGSPNYVLFAADTTDANGQAHVLTAFGTVAGPARVALHVPALGLADTARFTVTPGAATHVLLITRDTALAIGKRFTPNAYVADRFNNRRSEPVTFRTLAAFCSVDGTGQITAVTIGRCAIEVRADAGSDTARVSVVPDGTFVAAWALPNGSTAIRIAELDGSNVRNLANLQFGSEAYPSSTRGGSSVVYRDGDRLMIVEQSVTRRLLNSSVGLSWEGWARLSRDSAWVFFVANDAIHRVRRDGSGLERLTTAGGEALGGTTPDPSPDGTRVAYAANGFIRIHALGASAPPADIVTGTMPRWSPTGDGVAFFADGQIKVMDADGGNVRSLTPPEGPYGGNIGLDWSADARWMIVRGSGIVDVVNIATGEVLPLKYTGNAYYPSFLR